MVTCFKYIHTRLTGGLALCLFYCLLLATTSLQAAPSDHRVDPAADRYTKLLKGRAVPEQLAEESNASPEDEQTEEVQEAELEFYAELEIRLENLGNYALSAWQHDDAFLAEEEIALGLDYEHYKVQVLAEISLIGEQAEFRDETLRLSEYYLERGEMWLLVDELFGGPYALQIGRQTFYEPRQWWWDDDLDALRLAYSNEAWQAYAGLAQELGPVASNEEFIDPEEEDLRRLIGQLTWSGAEDFLAEGFFLIQRDLSESPALESVLKEERLDESDADLSWLGVRALGFIGLPKSHRLRYRLDLALVDGDETLFEFEDDSPGYAVLEETIKSDVRGWAADVDLQWTMPILGEPMVTLMYAYGSGDGNPHDGVDRNFRQTGLHDQDEEFLDYGVVLRPELSNLRITTLALTLPVLGDSYLDLGYHRFRQVYSSSVLRSAEVEGELTGENKDVGDELSLVLELRQWEELEIDFIAGSFQAGNAYGETAGERSDRLYIKFTYDF